MSEYAIRALDASTWDAFARLAEKHNGMGFGGCWCTWFHSREGRPEGEMGRPWKERLVREGKAHAALVFDGDAAVAWCQYRDLASSDIPARWPTKGVTSWAERVRARQAEPSNRTRLRRG